MPQRSSAQALVYVGDPMCSWCWGFAPQLRELADGCPVPVEVVVGGLRPGAAAEPLDDRLRAFLRHEWSRIAEVTGQPFDLAGIEREGWIYDTELPARAVVVARAMEADRTLDLFERIQRAFYAERIDVTDPDVYPGLVAAAGLDPEVFMPRLLDEASRAEAWRDFAHARRLGVGGFPSVLLRTGEEHVPVTRGYRPAADLVPLVEGLRREGGASPGVCETGGVC
jgi:putative protein-disulfide isomerase